MTIHVDIVALDHRLVSDDVDMVSLPGADGQMGILPGHAALLSLLDDGVIVLHKKGEKRYIAVHGGVVEVRPDKVTILANSAESSDEIDETRAQAALARAQEMLANNPPPSQKPFIEAQIRRSNVRLKVAQHRRSSRSAHFSDN